MVLMRLCELNRFAHTRHKYVCTPRANPFLIVKKLPQLGHFFLFLMAYIRYSLFSKIKNTHFCAHYTIKNSFLSRRLCTLCRKSCFIDGGRGGGRTRTRFLSKDFKSFAYTSSA